MDEKRRLPSWMVGASTTNNVNKPLDLDANNAKTKEDVIVVTESTRSKTKGLTRKRKKEDHLLGDEKGFLVKCGTTRKKGEFVEKDLIECHDREEGVVEKKKRGRVKKKVEEPSLSKKKRGKNDLESGNENEASSRVEEDEDLTMDDLLSFAKEFVENDERNMVQQKASEGVLQSKRISSCTSSSMTRPSLFASQDTRSAMHEETASHHEFMENNTSEAVLAEFRTTGDAAQDMLDLFLGHLLKKPIPTEDTNSIKDIIPPLEVKNQQHDVVISDKPVTFTKKKSSLRDAVAMFLD